MANWRKLIFGHGKWYILSSVLTKGANFILLKFLTTNLNPEEFGLLETIRVFSLLIPTIISFYLDSAFVRFYHEFKHDKKKVTELFSTIFIFILTYGLFSLTILLFTKNLWKDIFIPDATFSYLLYALFTPLVLQLAQLGTIYLRQTFSVTRATIIDVISVSINILITLILLLQFNFSIESKLIGNIVSAILVLLYFVVFFYKNGLLKLKFNISILKTSLIYSIPLIPNIAAGWITSLSDRVIISKYIGLEAVAIYAVASMISKIIYFVQDGISQVLEPLSLSGLISDEGKTKSKIGVISYKLFYFMLFLNLLLYLFSKELIFLFSTEQYSSGFLLIPVLGFTYVLSNQYRMFSTIIIYLKKTWVISLAAIFQGSLNLILNIIFVPIYGYLAASFSSVFSMLVYTLTLVYFSKKHIKIKLYYKEYFKAFFTFLITVWIIETQITLEKMNLIMKIVLVTFFSILLYKKYKK